MEGKIQKRKKERERECGRGENEKVMSEAHTSIYNFPLSSPKHQAVRGYVVQFSEPGFNGSRHLNYSFFITHGIPPTQHGQ